MVEMAGVRGTVAVGGIRTPLHAVHLMAWLRSHTDFGSVSVQFADQDPRCERELLAYAPELRLVAKQAPSAYVCVGSPSPRALSTLVMDGFRGQIVCVDEGLGSYADVRRRYEALRREGSSRIPAVLRSSYRQVAHRFGHRWTTFRIDDGRWVGNPQVGYELRASAQLANRDANRVVFLQQPWVRLGNQTASQERETVSRLADAVRRTDRYLVVRLHPSGSNIEISDVEVIPATGLAERDPVVLGAGLVLGETSTSLVNLAAFLERPVLSVTTGFAPKMSPLQRSLVQQYLGRPVTMQQLKSDPGAALQI